MKYVVFAVLSIAALFAAVPSASAAGIDWGVRAGVYTDGSDPFVGVEAITPLTRGFYFNPNVEWVMIDGGDLATINADVHYDFRIDKTKFWWAGGGLAFVYRNMDDGNDSDLGANILGGFGARVGGVIPYAQAKLLLSNENNLVAAVGIRF